MCSPMQPRHHSPSRSVTMTTSPSTNVRSPASGLSYVYRATYSGWGEIRENKSHVLYVFVYTQTKRCKLHSPSRGAESHVSEASALEVKSEKKGRLAASATLNLTSRVCLFVLLVDARFHGDTLLGEPSLRLVELPQPPLIPLLQHADDVALREAQQRRDAVGGGEAGASLRGGRPRRDGSSQQRGRGLRREMGRKSSSSFFFFSSRS